MSTWLSFKTKFPLSWLEESSVNAPYYASELIPSTNSLSYLFALASYVIMWICLSPPVYLILSQFCFIYLTLTSILLGYLWYLILYFCHQLHSCFNFCSVSTSVKTFPLSLISVCIVMCLLNSCPVHFKRIETFLLLLTKYYL